MKERPSTPSEAVERVLPGAADNHKTSLDGNGGLAGVGGNGNSTSKDESDGVVPPVGLSDDEHRKWVIKKSRFVHTPTSKSVLKKMEDLLAYPTRNRMPCMMIIGDPNSGKSSLLERFCKAHPKAQDPRDYADRMPVVHFELGDSSERGFYDDALDAMTAKVASSHNLQQKECHFLRTCRELEVKLLVVDEFHNGAHGTGNQQLKFLTLVKHTTNVLKIPLIVAGTDRVKTFINSESQLNSRFIYTARIPLWQDTLEYRAFLKALEKGYNLKKPSNLGTSEDLARKILELTGGLTGEIVHLLEFAALKAIDTGEERITMPILDGLVASEEWMTPSQRGL